jgi:hypothetical protein
MNSGIESSQQQLVETHNIYQLPLFWDRLRKVPAPAQSNKSLPLWNNQRGLRIIIAG